MFERQVNLTVHRIKASQFLQEDKLLCKLAKEVGIWCLRLIQELKRRKRGSFKVFNHGEMGPSAAFQGGQWTGTGQRNVGGDKLWSK